MKHALHNCPSCNKELTRVKRYSSDRLFNVLTFNRYYNKRYYCFSCLKSFAFSKEQIKSVNDNNKITEVDIAETQVPKLYIALVLFFLVASLAFAGNYIVSKNSSSISMNDIEQSDSQN
jgi:hypothetical protein